MIEKNNLKLNKYEENRKKISYALAGIGTQTILKANGSVNIVPPQIEYEMEPDDRLVYEVRDIQISIPLAGAITARIECFPNQTSIIQAIPKFTYLGPNGTREIKKVIFDDGLEWTVGQDET
jgi:hypothetical protein